MKSYVNKPVVSSNGELTFWQEVVNEFGLSEYQQDQFQRYASLLVEWNKKFNLTAIVDKDKIERYHFYDSIALSRFIDFSSISSTADVGTGGGFPGIPLKILFPHLTMTLIEVNNKKRSFLNHVIEQLNLENVFIFQDDWRTFLRTSDYPIDCFFARASLSPEELIRIFKPSSYYQKSLLVYWSSQTWQPDTRESVYQDREVMYQLSADVQRKYVFFKMK